MSSINNERIIVSDDEAGLKHISVMPEKNNKKIFIFSAVTLLIIVLILGLIRWAVFILGGFNVGIIAAIAWLSIILIPFATGIYNQFKAKEEIIISKDSIEIKKGGKIKKFKIEELQNIGMNDSQLRFSVFEAYKNIYIYDRGRIVLSFAGNKTPLHFGKCISEEEAGNILQFL